MPSIENILSRRFKVAHSPTLVARKGARSRIAFTQLKSDAPMRGRSLSVPAEDAFAIQVQLSRTFFSKVWIAGRCISLDDVAPGDSFLFDLSANPRVALDARFNTVRFYLPRAAMEEIADENGERSPRGLASKQLGRRDPVMHRMAQQLVTVMDSGNPDCALFADYAAIAFHDHVVKTYGDLFARSLNARAGGLTPRQMRAATEFLVANLGGNPSIADVAAECGLSSSHFARAFRRSTSFAPHEWLTQQRLSRAKDLLRRTELGAGEIAALCGFADQSHFVRVFSRHEGLPPGRWRRIVVD